MEPPATHQTEFAHLPQASQDWESVIVEQFQHPPGEATCHYSREHAICLALASRSVRLLHIRDGKTYTGLYRKGDILIAPAAVSFFARWEHDDNYLQIRVASPLIQTVAAEALDLNPDRLEIRPEFHIRDPQLEAIAMLFFAELRYQNIGEKLYIESLTNVLALHLLRHYSSTQSRPFTYKGGLPQRQLLQVLEYMHEHLSQNIKLADLAALIGISQYHFSHLFKQSIGIAPYQYLLQQRIERAKQLLKQTDQSIVEIAFLCGFNSHSHLSKQFRQLTGMTPTAYRAL